jgi:hypothetical protein
MEVGEQATEHIHSREADKSERDQHDIRTHGLIRPSGAHNTARRRKDPTSAQG